MVAIAKQSGIDMVLAKDQLRGDRSRSPSTHSEARNPRKGPNERKQRLQGDQDVGKLLNKIVEWLLSGEPKPAGHERVRFASDRRGRNLLHLMLDEPFDENNPLPQEALEFLEKLVLDKPELLIHEVRNKGSPLCMASDENLEALFAILALLVPHKVAEAIKTTCAGNSARCPLWDVHQVLLERCSRKSSANDTNGDDESEGSSLHRRPESDTTCLHRTVDVKEILQKNNDLMAALKKGFSESTKSCLHAVLDERHLDPRSTAKVLVDNLPLLVSVIDNSAFVTPDEKGYTPLHAAIKLYDEDAIAYEHLSTIIEILVQRYPKSIYCKVKNLVENENGKMALGLLRTAKKGTAGDSGPQAILRTEKLLKQTCIGAGSVGQDERVLILGAVRIICLNLASESRRLDRTYIKTIRDRSGMNFESVLGFVKLPYWNPQNDTVSQDGESPDGDVCNPYMEIFNWLWAKGATKIFTVEVEDLGPQPHTNAAMRWALRGNPEGSQDFHVEILKWKKWDVCCDSILRAAPEAKEVHLYSSGNTAVLRGWASRTSGLDKLHNLRKLIIEIHPSNASDEADCKAYEGELKRSIRDQCPQLESDPDIQFKDSRKVAVNNNAVDFNTIDKDANKPVDKPLNPKQWVQALQAFKSFARGLVKRDHAAPSIKVALLDDGVKLEKNTRLDALDGRQKGESFRPDNTAYFVGPCVHGTQMAGCIAEICPMVEFYIARLDDSRLVENQIYTSAFVCEALQWAVDMDVDVVSMSWSFKLDLGKEEDKRVKTLIDSIVQNGKILLFASLPDMGPSESISSFAPVGLPGVIKIGAATVFGENAKQNLYADSDFLVPGEDIPVPGSKDPVSGSSYATAYAAGLAALVLYSFKALQQIQNNNDPLVRNGDDTEIGGIDMRLQKAKNAEGMKSIFKVLSKKSATSPEKCLFVRPSFILNQEFGESADEKRKQMDKIAQRLLPDEALEALQHA